MKDNFYAYSLLLKKHYEQLTPDEDQELSAMLEAEPSLRELQAEIESIPKHEAQEFIRRIDAKKEYNKVLRGADDLHKKDSNRKRIWWAVSSAAAVVGVIFFLKISQTPVPEASIVSLTPQRTTLTLANGDVIAIRDSGTQQVMAGGTPIQNNNRSLSYKINEGATGSVAGLNELYVPARLDFKVTLSDGTAVWLNSTTRFRFPFSFTGQNREVYIEEGEAYFEVAANATQPFIVHTSGGAIQVLGTAFNVNAYTKGTVITSLVSGKVAFSAGVERIELKPGTEVVAKEGKLTNRAEFDQENTLSWRQGLHYFDNVTVTEVAVMLKRWFDVTLIIDNRQAGATEIRGKLNRNQPLDIFLDQVNGTKLVTFYWKGSELHCK